MKFRLTLLAFTFVLGGLASAAHAQGDPARGKALAYTCQGCHGVENYKNAYPVYRVPRLGGQRAEYIVSALKAYATQQRSHPTMYSHAATMSDQDMQDVAAFFAGAPIQPGNPVRGTPPAASQTCVACHGQEGVGITADYPTLSGQYADYLEHALKDYKNGVRRNPIMAGFASTLTDQDIKALSAFFAAQKGLCGTKVIGTAGKCP